MTFDSQKSQIIMSMKILQNIFLTISFLHVSPSFFPCNNMSLQNLLSRYLPFGGWQHRQPSHAPGSTWRITSHISISGTSTSRVKDFSVVSDKNTPENQHSWLQNWTMNEDVSPTVLQKMGDLPVLKSFVLFVSYMFFSNENGGFWKKSKNE